jgi:hypothetical protein
MAGTCLRKDSPLPALTSPRSRMKRRLSSPRWRDVTELKRAEELLTKLSFP